MIGLMMTPAIASDGKMDGPLPGKGTGQPISTLPLYRLALSNTIDLRDQVMVALENYDGDISVFDPLLEEISSIVASATVGSNYLFQKDQLVYAADLMQQLLAIL